MNRDNFERDGHEDRRQQQSSPNDENKRNGTPKYKGCVFKIKTRQFGFNESRAREEEQNLINKRQEIGLPGSGPVKRTYFPKNTYNHRKAPKVDNNFLMQSLQNNQHYMVRPDFEPTGEVLDMESNYNDSIQIQAQNQDKLPKGMSRSSSTGSEVNYKIEDLSRDFFSRNDLQNSKTLHSYDCWSNDLTPDEWVAKCQELPERFHAKCPFYQNNR